MKDKPINMRQWGSRFDYKGYGGCDCFCYIKVQGNTVLCTESPDNNGTSITNMAEGIAELICLEYHIPMDRLIWIEHYARDNAEIRAGLKEDFSFVEFTLSNERNPLMGRLTDYRNPGLHFSHPKWTYLDRSVALKMIGIEDGGEDGAN